MSDDELSVQHEVHGGTVGSGRHEGDISTFRTGGYRSQT